METSALKQQEQPAAAKIRNLPWGPGGRAGRRWPGWAGDRTPARSRLAAPGPAVSPDAPQVPRLVRSV
ncbi:hypothetical protein P7K49_020388 [Saguinus oedipus]|uniref:Uncharacterized protein n=1 Tax=Saguinus oedipus TaxID=9490 RepID=A0ABQ9V0D1_SAGOE|nr:hypothetical protein P7K49_020388 [Saguinus oedipus]